MKHDQFQELVSLFIDRELEIKNEQELFVHLSGCEECRAFLKATMMLQGDILDTKPSGAPSMAAIRALESLPKGRVLHGIWRRRVPFPVAATLGILALVSSMALGSLWLRPTVQVPDTKHRTTSERQAPTIQPISLPVVELR